MNLNPFKKKREPRVSWAVMVRINEDALAPNPSWNIVMAQNISASGILFNFDHYLAPEAWVQFKISLPGGMNVECDGQVVRNVTGSSPGTGDANPSVSAVAATFRNMEKQDRQMIREFVEQSSAANGSAKQTEASPLGRPGQKQRAKRIDRSYATRIREERSGEWELVTVRNISETGILFNHHRSLVVGSELVLSIGLPFSASPVVCRAKAVRVQDDRRPGVALKPYAIGAAFSDLSETMRKGLRDYGNQIGRD